MKLTSEQQTAYDELQQGCETLKLDLSETQLARLMRYLQLLQRWNGTYNLTAIRDWSMMVQRHLLDCLSVLPFVKGPRVLDVGSGAGLPGLIWALVDDSISITLIDSNGKKIRFLQQAVLDFQLTQVSVVQNRVESWEPPVLFDQISSRAFANLPEFIRLTRHLLAEKGEWLAMLGHKPAYLPASVTLTQAVALQVPFVKGARHLLRLVKA